MKTLAIILLTIGPVATFGQSKLVGYYSSNVAEDGFFITKILLKPDSTFKYEFFGDLFYDRGTGKYIVEKGGVILVKFEPDYIDSLGLIRTTYRPTKLLFKRGRIHEFNKNGKITTRVRGFSRHKKYLFFGDYYMTNRKIYLKRRNGNFVWLGEENVSE